MIDKHMRSLLMKGYLTKAGLEIPKTKNGYYDSDMYEGDGCAHDVKR